MGTVAAGARLVAVVGIHIWWTTQAAAAMIATIITSAASRRHGEWRRAGAVGGADAGSKTWTPTCLTAAALAGAGGADGFAFAGLSGVAEGGRNHSSGKSPLIQGA